ncbi:MAG: hypoxanthine phosphoribosyltransferase [Acidobacteriota bacterium]
MQDWAGEVGQILIPEERIRQRVSEMGAQITRDYRGEMPVFVGILRGAAVFHADLIRHVDLRLQVDYISVSSYGAATRTSGQVQLIKDLESSIQDTHVVLVEDIIDTGLTINYLLRNLQSRGPRSVKVCTLLSKPSRRSVEVPVDYVGFEIPDKFVVGFGLDYDQRYRNLPFIGVLNQMLDERD